MLRKKKVRPRSEQKGTPECAARAEAAHARAAAYLERTRETFLATLRAARSLGPAGHGVLAGPLVRKRPVRAPTTGDPKAEIDDPDL